MPKSLRNNLIPLILIALVVAYAAMAFAQRPGARAEDATFNELVSEINRGNIRLISVTADGTSLRATTNDNRVMVLNKEATIDTIQLLRNYGVTAEALRTFDYRVESVPILAQLSSVLIYLLPVLLIGGFFLFTMRRAQSGADQAFSFGRSRARRITSETPVVTFADVAGCDESKMELVEVVEFLKNPEKFIQLGARIPKGVLLVGPPGSGKTLLAKAVAGEAGVPFFSLSGSEFVELFVGVGASRVRDLFDQAKKAAPCIIFIDEIDAVGRQRGAGLGGGNDEREQTLNQMLVEMDGFNTDTNVIVIAATNRPDILDPALLRPGRFDRRVVVDAPDLAGREAILKVHVRGKPLAPNVDLKLIAKQTPGFTGADIENLVNEAAILAARANKKEIDQELLQAAIEKIALGPERKSRLMTPRDKEVVAYHEAGHAVTAALTPEAGLSLQKVTIIPRGPTGGTTWYTPETEDTIGSRTRKAMIGNIITLLGGRAAEEIVFGDVTAGAANDLDRASELARVMVRQYGMSDEIGPVSFGERNEMVFLGRELAEGRNYSEKVAELIDSEVSKLIRTSYDRARKLLIDNRDRLNQVAQALLEKETIDREEFKVIMGMN
ncbi:MAG: ATP-dependent zinc metalloprotease FtsH [Anaerolineae bacterium]|nr:ATP-dependent zinc metalloprotease FtsH [Thermoflexales bacterium]MDW8407146.1 ATP-dependent zinc metalloprotease FtsH [Anaerolineae bacterium]